MKKITLALTLLTLAACGGEEDKPAPQACVTKLKVYKGAQHPHAAQQPAPLKINN